MRRLRGWMARLEGLFNKHRKDQELADEIESHLQMHAEDNLRSGMAPAEARRQAIIKLGGIESTKEAYRDQRGLPILETLLQDVRHGFRSLRKNPGFTAAAVLTLALGIGANTAMFSVIHAVLLRPLSYKDASQVVNVWMSRPHRGDWKFHVPPADFADFQAGSTAFDQMVMYDNSSMNLTGEGAPEEVSVGVASAGLFRLLGVPPRLGRAFASDEDQPGKSDVAILGYGLWQRRLGGKTNVLGKTIALDGKSYQIVGVMPRGFKFPQQSDLWIPRDGSDVNAFILARLKPGVKLPQAQADLDLMLARLAKEHGKTNIGLRVETLQETMVGGARSALLLLLGAVGLVLLIACINVGNLVLGRGLKRQKEMGIRASLGAGRRRIIQLLCVESMLLALAGGIAGLLLACWGVNAIRAWAPANTPRLEELRIEPGILWIALAITTAAGMVFGLFPVLQFSRPDSNAALKETSSASTGTSAQAQIRSALVILEIAMALVLLVSSSLTLQSLWRFAKVDLGFRTDHLLTMSVYQPASRYPLPASQTAFLIQALDRMKSLPGVESASACADSVMQGGYFANKITIEGGSTPGVADNPPAASSLEANTRRIEKGYFHTLGIRVISGREFSDTDKEGSLPVAIINEAMAKLCWPGVNPIGKRLFYESSTDGAVVPVWREVVGVVSDAREMSPGAAPVPEVFAPFAQFIPGSIPYHGGTIAFFLRTSQNPASLASAAEKQIWAVDLNQPVSRVSTMDIIISGQATESRFRASLLGAFAALGLVLALTGIYGVISHSVSQRTREIGIRMALGAEPPKILRLVLWQGMKLTTAGLTAGIIGSFAATRLLRNLLFGIDAADPLTFTAGTLLIACVALAACWIPARRAAKIAPLTALRGE